MTTAIRRPFILIVQASLLAACAISLPARAQVAPTPTPTPTPLAPNGTVPATGADKTVELSPFQVSMEGDAGYQAANTTSGSRLNTSLKDTAASISPFTPEFLSDIAATNVNDMLAYATNAETNAGDSEGAGFNNPRNFNSAGGEPFRIRGIPGGVSIDYVENAAPADLYNIDRAEIASGANSILFGSGDAGGLVALSSKKALLPRTRYVGVARIGSWNSQRYTTDLNQMIVPKVLAVRVNGVYENDKSWRVYDWNDIKRYSAAVTYRPFEHTTFNASYENGLVGNSIGLRWNLSDQMTRYVAAGRPITDGAADATVGTASLGANQRFTYVPQDGVVYNLRNELTTTTAPKPVDTLLPPSIFPYDVNWAGPSTRLKRDFYNYQVSLEQGITKDLTIQGIFLKNKTNAQARSFVYNSNNLGFYGDPNLTIAAPNGTGTVANPHAGQLYLETNESGDSTITENEIKRLTIAYELRLGKWFGDHRMAALGEDAVQHRHTESHREILVDQFGVPVQNAAAPENAQNLVWRRTYVKEGDYSTYALTGLYTPLKPFDYTNGRTLSSRQVTTGELSSIKDTNSLMLAMQSSWYNNFLSTTLGFRRDKIIYSDTPTGTVAAGDARIASGQKLLNEVTQISTYNRNDVKASTFTVGGVLHLTKRFSLLYNHSDNIGAPRFDRRILPDGRIPGTPKGKDSEYGAMIDVLGDDRFFARVSYFETSQIGDAGVSPSGAVTNATTLGRAQTLAVLDAFLAAGKITQAQRTAQGFNWNAAIIDTASKGVEVDLVANPTRNWTVRLNYSYSERDRLNFFAEGRAFFAAKAPEWRATAGTDPVLQALVEANLASIFAEIEDRADGQEQGFGSIPHKATATSRYKFSSGPLKGLFFGGAGRYQSKVFAQTDTRAASAGGTGKDYYANMTLFFDAFAGYSFNTPWWKAPVTIQGNVKNLTNSYGNSAARYNSDFSGARRIYLRDPRQYIFTATLTF